EDTINSGLATFAADIPEFTSLTLDIQDGSFELVAEGKKVMSFKSRTRFEIASCEISAEKQIITFHRVTPTELSADKLIDRILVSVFKAIACQIFKIEPAKFVLEGVPGITVVGDDYTVDLSQTYVAGKVTPKIEGFLKVAGMFVKVKELKCVPKAIQVVFGR
ncbi:MAG: hypothetical protein Q8O24_05500, partial [Gallionellaceae bacterium]|nr:hypothetical protein [Gallionellaceae bacterium]